tara:strand:- start:76 stop:600 length:525 start_codon:yes stop_codon:yes gene_type:complete
MAKHSKNLQRVSDMLDGTYKNKIQVGVGDQEAEPIRKVGDRWTDSDDVEWEQKQGYRVKINKLPNVGIFRAHCKDCDTGILKPWDKDTHKADGRCYHCQLNYELDLQYDKPIRWFAYRRLKDFKNMESIQVEMEQWIDERQKILQENPYDESVANAMANSNVEMTINKNKEMTK